MNFILLVLSVLPVVVIAWFIWQRDNEKEPLKLLLKLFGGGLLSTVLTLLFTFILCFIFPFFRINHYYLNLFELFISVFIGVALVEEFSKWLMAYFIAFRHQAFDHKYDGIVYATFVSLGFALFENILYVLQGGMVIGIIRALLTVPGHAAYGISMGYYLDLAKIASLNNEKVIVRKNLILSVLMPTILHGIFDYCLFAESGFFILVFLVFIMLFFRHTWKRIKKVNGDQSALHPKNDDEVLTTEKVKTVIEESVGEEETIVVDINNLN